MSAFTNDGENLLLNWMFTTGSPTRPTAWFVGLHTGDPGETGASNEVLVGSDSAYIRQAVTMGAATTGTSASTTQVVYTPAVAAGTYDVTHASIWTAATAGTCLIKGALASARSISNASPITFEIGEIIAAID
jgi:hypothetical protein